MSWHFESIERQIITHLSKNRKFAVNVIMDLDPELFTNKVCSLILKIMKIFYTHRKSIPDFDFLKSTAFAKNPPKDFDWLEAENIYVNTTLSDSEQKYIEEQIPLWIKHSKFKALLLENASVLGETDLENFNEYLDGFYTSLKEIISFDMDQDLGLNIFDIQKRYALLSERSEMQIRPKLKSLQRVIKGYAKKELYSYVGAPGVGKSILLANDAIYAFEQGRKVVFISLELSEEMFGLRMDQSITQTEADWLLREQIMALKKLEAALNNRKKSGAGDLQIKEFGTGEASVSHIERYLELLYMYNEFVADFIVIDYGDIMKPIGKSTGDRYKDQGKVFQELRAFAKNHNVPVLTAAQTNRPPYGQRHAVITEERLADSYDKLRTLDGCYSINPKVIRGEDDDGEGMEIQTNEHYLWIIKNRNGIKDVEVPFLMKKDTMQIYDVEQ